jgi:hypothetical protein
MTLNCAPFFTLFLPMNNLVKAFEGHEVRFVEHPEHKFRFGVPAVDLARALGTTRTGSGFSRSIFPEWKGSCPTTTLGGNQTLIIIWEPGIYQAIGKSSSPKAEPFQRWLFGEVIPTLFQTGSYSALQTTGSSVALVDSIGAFERKIDSLESFVVDLSDQLCSNTNELNHRFEVFESIFARQLAALEVIASRLQPQQAVEPEQLDCSSDSYDLYEHYRAEQKQEWEEFCQKNGWVKQEIPRLPALYIAKKLGYSIKKEDYLEFEKYMQEKIGMLAKPKRMTDDGYTFNVLHYLDVPVVHGVVKDFFSLPPSLRR